MAHDPHRLDALRVDLAALRRRGVAHHLVEASLPVPWLAHALRDTDAEVGAEASLRLELLLQPEGVVVARGPLTLAFEVPCGRCLSPAAVDGSAEIFVTYLPGSAADPHAHDFHDDDDPEAEHDLDEDGPDHWRYDGVTLQLDAMVAEQVALAYPMRALCPRGDACRGLCSNCGYELNTVADDVLCCPGCGNEVPRTPVADLPAAEGGDGEAGRDKRKGESALAAALRDIDLD